MQFSISKIGVLFGIVFLHSTCVKKNQYSVVPALTYQSYQVFSHSEDNKTIADSAYITFNFQDGDGDLGTSDNSKPSLFLKYYEDQGNGFVYLSKCDSIFIPSLTPKGSNKEIEGTFVQIIKPAPIYNIFTSFPYQWRVTMIDRAGHESNVIQTPSQTKL